MPSADETKYFDTSFSQTVATGADWTGTEVPCTNYVQLDGTTLGAYTDSALIPSAIGSGFGQVVGSKYKLHKIRVRGHVASLPRSDQADMIIAASVRCCLVMDTRPNGSQAQGEDLFLDMGTAAQNNFSFMSMGAGQGGRFRILKDYIFHLDAVAAGTDGANTNSVIRGSRTFSFSWKPKEPVEVIIKTSGSTPATSQLASHNIFLLAHTSLDGVSIVGCARAYYQG